jgi:glycosyltransferase involved in cell wall biosynthesis
MTSDPRQFPAFWQDLTKRVRETAHRRGTTPQEELQQFVLQRVMARQFTANPDDWMIKGGQTLLARWPDGRSTSDIDMVGMPGASRATMVGNYTSALHQDLDDHLSFELDYDGELQHGKGARLKHKAFCGGREIGDVSVDLAPPRDRPMWAEPEMIRFPEQIMSTGAEGENPQLKVISLTDTLAHKVSGMYTQGVKTEQTKCDDCLPRAQGQWSCQSGDLPYRVQDMVDVMMIATNRPWEAAAVQDMLRQEFGWRINQGEPIRVPNQFYVPNPEWREGFRKYAAATPGLPFKTIEEATPVAKAFLNPLLDRTTPATGTWDPELRQWTQQNQTGDRDSVELSQQAAAGQPALRVLVVAHASGREAGLGGLPVASGELTKALAGLENAEVTLLTIGETEEHGNAQIISVPQQEGESPRVQLLNLATHDMPDSVPGMPAANSDAYDVVVGHARFSGWAAMLIRNRWYPQAQLAHVLHMPAKEYAEVQDWPARGEEYHRIETAVVQSSDLVVGVGPLLTDLGAEMADGAPVAPSFHQLVPGVETLGEVGDPPDSEEFRLLFSGRVNDPIKGYDDLLATVKELNDRGVPVQLRVRGVKDDQLEAQQQRADEFIGRPGVIEVLPYTTDRRELLGDYQWAHAAVMPSRIEGYGLVGAEAAAHGVPVLVNAESGVGQFLNDADRIPAHLGAQSVVPDQGLRADQAGRVEAWAGSIEDLRNDYGDRRAAAGELKDVLQQYSWNNAAQALSEAARGTYPGANISTAQGPDGQPVERRPTVLAARNAAVAEQEAAPTTQEADTSPETDGQQGGPVQEEKGLQPAKDDLSRFMQSGSPNAAPARAADGKTTGSDTSAGEADRTQRGSHPGRPGHDSGRG